MPTSNERKMLSSNEALEELNGNNAVNIQKRHLSPQISVCWLACHHPPRKYLLTKYHTHRKRVNWNPPPPPELKIVCIPPSPKKTRLPSMEGARIFDGTALIRLLNQPHCTVCWRLTRMWVYNVTLSLRLCLATAIHNLKRLKITHFVYSKTVN